MKTLYSIRNAEHRPARVDRWPTKDTGLSKEGREQAIRLAKALRNEGIAELCASGHARAHETAEPLARRCGTKPTIVEAFDPMPLGVYEDMGDREAAERIGETVLNEIVTSPSAVKDYFGSGESLSDVASRAWRGLQGVIHATKDGRATAICTHEEVIGALLCKITGMPLKNVWFWGGRLEPARYGALTELEWGQTGWKIVRCGCTCIAGMT
jgi:broad specificity phosphatase PhoE